MHWRADTGTAHALNFGMTAPRDLKIADFPLSGEGVAGDLFPWDRVIDDRNVLGATHRSVFVNTFQPVGLKSRSMKAVIGKYVA